MAAFEPSRRGFLTGLGAALITAPAIVRASSLMAVKAIEREIGFDALLDRAPYMASPSDLAAVVRRAFVPRLFVQIYETSPLLRFTLDSDGHLT